MAAPRRYDAPDSRSQRGRDADANGSAAPPLTLELHRTAAEIFHVAQESHTRLQQLLATQPLWARDVDAERAQCRALYLGLVFGHPLSTYAQSLDHLWLHTSYALIAAYRAVIARLQAAAAAAAPAPAPASRKARNAPDPSASELRKTLTRLRQYLGSEETFYRGLVSRLVGFYQLQRRVAAPLSAVGIGVPDEIPGGGPEHGLSPPLSRDEAEKKVALVYKGLICLGDLERYKEQYGDHGKKEGKGSGGRKRPGTRDTDPFGKAKTYYEVARGLQPDNGVAFNQLAVIATYTHDHFCGVYHYCRAYAVAQPFPNAEANLERALKRVFERWREVRAAADAPASEDVAGPDTFKRDFVVIVAILFARAGTSHLAALQDAVLPRYAQLLAARELPSEAVVKSTAMALAAHWHARLGASTGAPRDAARPPRKNVEHLALLFLLNVLGTLLRVAAEQVDDALVAVQTSSALDDSAPPEEADGHGHGHGHGRDDADDAGAAQDAMHALAQHIPAALRRILPALRLASRWIKANLGYLHRAAHGPDADLVWATAAFWATYKRAMLGLARLFPLGQMPGLDEPLEEDVDMRGFLPVKRSITNSVEATQGDDEDRAGHREVHPNEEQLMRIADLLVDVKLLMQTDAGSEVLKINAPPAAYPAVPLPSRHRKTDDLASVSTETEDDPVNLAMRATLGEGSSVGEPVDANDDEVIVWNRPTPLPAIPVATNNLERLSLAPAPTTPPALARPPSATAHAPGTPQMLFGGHDGIWAMSRDESQQGKSRAQQAAVKALWDQPTATAGAATPTLPLATIGQPGLAEQSIPHLPRAYHGAPGMSGAATSLSAGWHVPGAPAGHDGGLATPPGWPHQQQQQWRQHPV
ncbi:hypothetical protein Q5752_002119 [Cryptotrichosporon argae]